MLILLIFFMIFTFDCFFPLEYKVKDGDTLWSISKRFNTDPSLIEKINEIMVLKSGQIIFIPDEIIDYKVGEWDNLILISKKFSTPLKYIIILNNLKSEQIYKDQLLKIPIFKKNFIQIPESEKKENLITHIVKNGETLYSISKAYGVGVEDIIRWNNKKNNTVFTDERLKIYCGEQSLTKKEERSYNVSWAFPLKDRGAIAGYSETRRGLTFFLKKEVEIYNVKSGVVEFIGHINGYDKVIIIKSGNYKIVYGYLNEIYVKKGMVVKTGELIANTEYHNFLGKIAFYLEIREGKKIVNLNELFSLKKDELFARK